MQNPWIFNEYVRWTSPPLSFVSPTQDVGKLIFTMLANFPYILFSRPRTESMIQFGMSYEASIRPSLSLCIQDLMDGSSEGLATPINSIFGIQAPPNSFKRVGHPFQYKRPWKVSIQRKSLRLQQPIYL